MTEPAAPPPLQDAEWHSPSPAMWRARRLVLLAVAVPTLLVAALVVGVAADPVAGAVTAAVLLLVAGWVAWLLWRRYQAWGYAERAEDLLVRRGVMVRRVCVVPYGRMQFIDVTAGPVDRMFGLATVQLHTAAAATDARIPGLDRARADRLRDHLADLGEAKATGL
ncbi:MAG TPA: PH domain-containing protein [Mycobacteriales bacterium]|nr:PH domain-containing protein [Mycobacteriales bacterium]